MFKTAQETITKNFVKISKTAKFLYQVNVDPNAVWETYLENFLPEHNKIFRSRREHDCSSCRRFVRKIGNIVGISSNYELQTIWDSAPEGEYQKPFKAVETLLKNSEICSIALFPKNLVGTPSNLEMLSGEIVTWKHFHVSIPSKFLGNNKTIPTQVGDRNTRFQTFKRSLDEITPDALSTVLELISEGTLYRGAEFRTLLTNFQEIQREYLKLASRLRTNFVWANVDKAHNLRGSAIGTLLVSLSNNEDLESSVGAYEAIMAPASYQRPKTLVTRQMLDKAREEITALGFMPSLERRYATLDDLNVNDVLYWNRPKPKADDVFGDIPVKTPDRKTSKIEEISIEKFVKDILPQVSDVSVIPEFEHRGNLVTLVAPVDPTAPNILKWDNPFSWSYAGGFADSIKEKVKKANGNIIGELCCRLAWYNTDDLDFWMLEPGGYKIYYQNKGYYSPGGKGMLDVDMNAAGETRTPVENIFYPKISRMTPGRYKLMVNQFRPREFKDVGFDVEIQILDKTYYFRYPQRVTGTIEVATLTVDYENGIKLESPLALANISQGSQKIWGVNFNDLVKVTAITLSPNFWGESKTGNKHYLFFLENCKADEVPRPFYNEILTPKLDKHKKVLEQLGGKLKVDGHEANQLSGLGFSDTQRNSLMVKVSGNYTRKLKINF